MRITANRESFLKSVLAASQAVPRRTTNDVLKNVLMVVVGPGQPVTMIATNTEIGLRIDCLDVDVKGDARVLLPGRLIDILREGSGETVMIESTKRGLDVRFVGGAVKGEFELVAGDGADFPKAEAAFNASDYVTISAANLKKAIRRTIFAVDENSTKYALAGVQIEFGEDGQAIFAATDSKRLSVVNVPFTVNGSPVFPQERHVVPVKALKLVDSMAEGGDVQIAWADNSISFKIGQVTVNSQLLGGRFPDWRRVMPQRSNVTIDLIVAAFLGAMRQAMVVREKDGTAINFAVRKGEIKFSSEVADMGESIVALPIQYEGESFKAAFDPSFFSDFLKAFGDSSAAIALNFTSHDEPAMITATDCRYVVLPLSR